MTIVRDKGNKPNLEVSVMAILYIRPISVQLSKVPEGAKLSIGRKDPYPVYAVKPSEQEDLGLEELMVFDEDGVPRWLQISDVRIVPDR